MTRSITADGHEWPRGVVNENEIWSPVRQRGQSSANRRLPRGSAVDRRCKLVSLGRETRRIEIEIIRMDDRLQSSNCAVARKDSNSARKHGPPANECILFGYVRSRPGAASGGDDKGGDAHVNGLHCQGIPGLTT